MSLTECVNPQQVEDNDYMAYLDEAARPEFRQHLQTCDYCRHEVQNYASTASALKKTLTLTKAPFRSACPDTQVIGEYALGISSGQIRQDFETHVTSCKYCTQEYGQLQGWLSEAKAEEVALSDSPVGVAKKWLGRVVATILKVAPAPNGLLAAGLRGAAQHFPVTYEAEGVAISITVQNAGSNRLDLQVMGLVFADDENQTLEAEGAPVRLMQGSRVLATETVDDLGNFFFDGIKPVDFDLEIQLSDRIVLIPGLHKSNS